MTLRPASRSALTNALRPELADAAFNLWLLDRPRRMASDRPRPLSRDEALEQGALRLCRPRRRHRHAQSGRAIIAPAIGGRSR